MARSPDGAEIQTVRAGADSVALRRSQRNRERNFHTRARVFTARHYLAALLAVGCVTGLSLPFRAHLDTVDVLIFYLVAVTGIALLANTKASIIAALAAFLAFNFFYTDPNYTFFVANTHDILALAAFIGLSILISRLVVRARSRTLERQMLAEERARAEILRRTDELRKALLSTVSHDLRTPLTSIKAATTTLLQPGIDWDAAERRELLTGIDEETDRLNRIVTNLLDLSRIEAGALQPARDWYAPEELIRDVLERFSRQLEGREVSVELPPQDTLVEIDFVMISEVLANLIENAVSYSPAGAPLRIAARLSGATLEIEVEDRGVGILPGEEERIFDPFYRAQAARSAGGSGMGLAIARGFVEAHGGRLWVARNAAGGSTFTFSLPLAGHDAADAGLPVLVKEQRLP